MTGAKERRMHRLSEERPSSSSLPPSPGINASGTEMGEGGRVDPVPLTTKFNQQTQ